jgi:ABC-type taurine transport system ATPase subunit
MAIRKILGVARALATNPKLLLLMNRLRHETGGKFTFQ